MTVAFEIGKVYTFNTLSPVFLGAIIERAKLKSIVDADTARRFAPIDQLHAQVYPTLPANSPKDVNSSVYYIFEGQNKSTVVLSKSWIDETSIEVIEHIDITVRIPQASLSDIEKVRIALSAAGFKDFSIQS